ncbi:MOSC domain-containing protein [Rhizobium sp. Leaf341]|uniref:MOSC domain-containing protein n=1 Tax=Rhizobium sp. Leaf341 TaxID=1736344 RepID=UPI00071330DC|nr:MOSC domain-containing protein [Rhizobium sp. Leaf341]KQR78007.1 molybdenum cofactor biosysynthesis protein [Rhizobium sp. Leaf341]
MKIDAVCVGHATVIGGKIAKTGIVKHPQGGAVIVDAAGLAGDAVCNRKHHGGPDQAVYGLGSLDLDAWAEELGHAVPPGLFGENLVVSDVDSRAIAVGDRFETDTVTLEVTSTRIPCSTLALRFNDPGFARRFRRVGRPGFYCRVLRPGMMCAGERVVFHAFQGPRITMPEMLATAVKTLSDAERARYRAAPISERVRAQLEALQP